MIAAYRRATALGGTSDLVDSDNEGSNDDSASPDALLEERRRYSFHRRLERNGRLAREAKRIHGHTCRVCSFNFARAYGPLGEGFIEAHHLTPLHKLPADGAVPLSPKDDFAVLCANCHRMVHRKGAPTTLDEFAALFHSTMNRSAIPGGSIL